MSRPLAPRLPQEPTGPDAQQVSQRTRKIGTACNACKQRKTKCSGGSPCDACSTRGSACIYDEAADQRRKIANRRNMENLQETQVDLEKHQQLLGGLIATIRAGDSQSQNDLIALIRSGADLSTIAASVRNELLSNVGIQQAFDDIDFNIDGPEELPSPSQILSGSQSSSRVTPVMISRESEAGPSSYAADTQTFSSKSSK